MRKVNLVENRKYSLRSLLLIFSLIFIILFINGCARWPDGPDGGNGVEQKLLVIRVGINGKINTEDGHYYIVFDTKDDALTPPSEDIENWKEGYYYIRLDDMGFCFGQWSSSCQYDSIGNAYDKYFQVNIDLEYLGNPERIFMNIITTDNDDDDDETIIYDYINNSYDLTINDTYLSSYNNIVDDFPSDSAGGPNFDITRVTVNIY
ncbi:MAG TPA: hypothetical protein DEG96_08715 [Candidatus Atribacteria bacterium]|nr:hypothetical protein [Candidatus Atribacteria bacterium]